MDTEDVLEVIENETKENIENLLRYYECDDSILVDSIKCMAGSRDGDNYMSVVKRVLVKGRQNNNQSGECITHFLYFILLLSRTFSCFVPKYCARICSRKNSTHSPIPRSLYTVAAAVVAATAAAAVEIEHSKIQNYVLQ